MQRLAKRTCLGIALSVLLSTATPAAATTSFSFQFDSAGVPAPEGPLVPPIVGSGTFVSPVNLNAGTYDLSALAGFQLHFNFLDGNSYSNSDISTPLSGLAIQIMDVGDGTERLFFVESGAPGSDGGPHGGALDLDNGMNFLSFAPSSFGSYLYQESGASGQYLALGSAVPEPSTWAMMLLGFGVIGFAMRSKRTLSPQPRMRYRMRFRRR